MVHGVNDGAHGKPFELSAEQRVIDDVEQHSCNCAIQDLLEGKMGQLCIGSSGHHEGHNCPGTLLHRGTCTGKQVLARLDNWMQQVPTPSVWYA